MEFSKLILELLKIKIKNKKSKKLKLKTFLKTKIHNVIKQI